MKKWQLGTLTLMTVFCSATTNAAEKLNVEPIKIQPKKNKPKWMFWK